MPVWLERESEDNFEQYVVWGHVLEGLVGHVQYLGL